jgi:hypothetical protein
MSVTTEAASFGQKKARVVASVPFGTEAKLLISGSLYDDGGENPLFIPAFKAPATNNGQAIGVDGEKGYHFFSNLVWRGWSVIGEFTSRSKVQPICGARPSSTTRAPARLIAAITSKRRTIERWPAAR